MSKDKKKIYNVPFSNAFVLFVKLLVYGIHFVFLFLLYRLINSQMHFEAKWVLFAWIIGTYINPIGFLSGGISFFICGIPTSVVSWFLRTAGHTAAVEQQRFESEERKKKRAEAYGEAFGRAWQNLEKEEATREREKNIREIFDFANSIGFQTIPTMEEFQTRRDEILESCHPKNGETAEEYIRMAMSMEKMEEIVKVWQSYNLYEKFRR